MKRFIEKLKTLLFVANKIKPHEYEHKPRYVLFVWSPFFSFSVCLPMYMFTCWRMCFFLSRAHHLWNCIVFSGKSTGKRKCDEREHHEMFSWRDSGFSEHSVVTRQLHKVFLNGIQMQKKIVRSFVLPSLPHYHYMIFVYTKIFVWRKSTKASHYSTKTWTSSMN